MIRLFVGLGNPGAEYEDTRHNAGFWLLDEIAHRLKASFSLDRSFFGWVVKISMPSGPIWLLKPNTFMNLSGKSVSAIARFFKIEPSEILVVHDELDLLPGQVKIKYGGSHAGHNGLKDIHAQLGSPDYWRLRLGIGHPGVKSEVVNYVLRKPPAAEREAIRKSIEQSMSALELMIAGDMNQAMMKIHAKPARPKLPRQLPEASASKNAAAIDDTGEKND